MTPSFFFLISVALLFHCYSSIIHVVGHTHTCSNTHATSTQCQVFPISCFLRGVTEAERLMVIQDFQGPTIDSVAASSLAAAAKEQRPHWWRHTDCRYLPVGCTHAITKPGRPTTVAVNMLDVMAMCQWKEGVGHPWGLHSGRGGFSSWFFFVRE